MKKYIFIPIAILFLILGGCETDDGLVITSFKKISASTTHNTATITIQMAYTKSSRFINSNVPDVSQYGVYYSTTQAEPTGRDGMVVLQHEDSRRPDELTVEIDGLQPNTTYYYRVFVRNALNTLYSDTKRFTTQTGGSEHVLGSTIEDFIGTYNVSAYCLDEQRNVTWSNVKIFTKTYNSGEWVIVSGLNKGLDFEQALGQFDANNKAIRLYAAYYDQTNAYTFEGNDTLFVSSFYPLYISSNDIFVITDGAGYDGTGEAWLTFNSQGQLTLGGSEYPDSNGYKANGYAFLCSYLDTQQYYGWFYVYKDVVLTKISTTVAAPARLPSIHRSLVPRDCQRINDSFRLPKGVPFALPAGI